MNKTIAAQGLLGLLGLCLVTNSWAQKPQTSGPAEPPAHFKKIYRSPEGDLYLHPKQPLYFQIAATPEGPAFPMRTKAEAALGKSGPFVFTDGAGQHTLVHPVEEGHFWKKSSLKKLGDENIFLFHLDGEAPKSQTKITGARQASGKRMTYFGGPIKLAVVSTDHGPSPKTNQSGVEDTWVSIDGAAFDKYQGPLSFGEEKTYDLRFYAVDRVGNVEKMNHFVFRLDLTKPESTMTQHGPRSGSYLGPKSSVSIKADDQTSGIGGIGYKLSGPSTKSGQLGARPLTMEDFKSGKYKLAWAAKDRVGNKEPEKTYEFDLDRTPPRLKLEAEGGSFQAGKLKYVSRRSKLVLVAEDQEAGVAWTRYQMGGKTQVYQAPVPVPERSGAFQIKAWAADNSGNQGNPRVFDLALDAHPPATKFGFDGPFYQGPKGRFVSPKSKLKLTAVDNDSGVKEVLYGYDDAPPAAYKDRTEMPQHGEHHLNYYAIDQVDNQEQNNKVRFFVDGKEPQIAAQFSVGAMGEDLYPRGSMLFVSATDEASGLERIYIALGTEKETLYDGPVRFDQPGAYQVKLVALDRVGNRSSKTLKFTIR